MPPFIYLKEFGRSFNRNFLVRRGKRGAFWVGKQSRSLAEKGVYFSDLNARAILAYRLARTLDMPVIPYKVVPGHTIEGLDMSVLQERIDDEVFLSRLSGQPLPIYLEQHDFTDITNLSQVWEMIVFNAWIGNHDRKDGDYIVTHDHQLFFIDYQLCGPGFIQDPQAAIGAYAETYTLDDPTDIGWCVGGPQLIEFVRKRKVLLNQFSPMIDRIENLPLIRLTYAMRGLHFFDERGEKKITKDFFTFLIERRSQLRAALGNWIKAGYPQGERPKDPAREDHIYQ